MAHDMPKLRKVAERVLGFEAVAGRSATDNATAAMRVFATLNRVFSTVLGTGGFRALLERTLTLAQQTAPALAEVQLGADGSLHGLERLRTQSGKAALAQAEVVLVVRLLELLENFIGAPLLARLLHQAYPQAPVNELNVAGGEES